MEQNSLFRDALWRIYNRPEIPQPWEQGGNLPWDDPDFSARMLREHLDQSHGAASRVAEERALQIDWLWRKLGLQAGKSLLDITCGPGLYATEFARLGLHVTGIDFGPASIEYAVELAASKGVSEQCQFILSDVRQMAFPESAFDAATFIYGQLAVFTLEEAKELLAKTAQSLRPGGTLCVELLNQERVDKKDSSWWFTDHQGLWGNTPFLHLGERFWNSEKAISIERFHILQLESGQLDQVTLCDQTYSAGEMIEMMKTAGFAEVDVYRAWDGLPLYDAEEWIVYICRR